LKEPIDPVKNRLSRRKPSGMSRLTWIMIGTVIAAFVIFKQVNAVKPETAREWLKKGATVIDVRSEAEFQERHLPGTINVPLDRLRDEIARVAPNKEQPLLLHCLSGTRSPAGGDALKKMGYRNVFNLGSYSRAEEVLGAQGKVGKRD
jgi:rhodanese-related sulfurtransferase